MIAIIATQQRKLFCAPTKQKDVRCILLNIEAEREGDYMAMCKECIHYYVCRDVYKDRLRCADFKNKADFVEVVRCKDCKHYDGKWLCSIGGVPSRKKDDFCSYGERSET